MEQAKIVHLTSVHRPDDTRVFQRECKTLARAGYEVVFVAPGAAARVVDGVRTRPVPVPTDRRDRVLRIVPQVLRAAREEEAALYHFHDPELIPVGLLLKALGRRVVYDVHEDVSADILTKPYLSPFMRRALSRGAGVAERLGAAAFDAVVAATPAIAARFPGRRTVAVQNFPERSSAPAEVSCGERPPWVTYLGGISETRGIREMIRAVALLPDECGARLCLAGVFSPPALEREIRALPGWDRVDFLGWRSAEGVRDLLGRSRIGLVLFHPAPNHGEAQPNKLFEYLAAGLPVVASDFALWRTVVEETGCGLCVDPLDARAISEAVRWLLEHPCEADAMGRRGREAARSRYCWEGEAAKLLGLYRDLVGSAGAG